MAGGVGSDLARDRLILPSAVAAAGGGRERVDLRDGVLAVIRIRRQVSALDVRAKRERGVRGGVGVTAGVGGHGELRQLARVDLRHGAIVLQLVHFDLRAKCMQIEFDGAGLGVIGRAGKLRNDGGSQDGHDDDHNEHFNQRETAAFARRKTCDRKF